jgi:Tfp pilus assembly protein PilX
MKTPQNGQAALIMVIIIMSTTLALSLGVIFVSFTNQRITRNIVRSSQGYYLAEAGIEDSLLRIMDPALDHQNNTTVTLNGQTATIDVSQNDDELTVTSEGNVNGLQRTVATTLEENTTKAAFFYGIQVDSGGMTMGNNSRVNGNVYSNGSITGGNGSTITGDAIVAGGLDDVAAVEWTAHTADQLFATASSNRDIAQRFTATESGPLTKVSVYLGKQGNPSNNLTLHITTDNAGKPDTDELASTTIARTSVGIAPSWIDASFSSPPDLANGTKYWLVLDYNGDNNTNHWNWRKDPTNAYADNTGRYTSNWSLGSSIWNDVGGDLAFRAWIGGTVTGIDGLTIGDSTSGMGRANLFTNTKIHDLDCPNQYCLVENPPRENLPISDGVIQDWQNAAETGGVHSGDYILDLDGESASLGPKKITGKLKVDNGATLNITGTIWVEGDIDLSNGCDIHLDNGYGSNSGVLLTSGKIVVSNNCTFAGSGDPDSYLMALSAKDSPNEEVITVDNNAAGVIYYAGKGRIKFSNNAQAKEATAYGLTLDNNAIITYESGLQNIFFTAGPAGGWDILSWQEVE